MSTSGGRSWFALAGSPAFVDGTFVFLLGAVSFAGFQSTFAGVSYFFVGSAGLLFGVLLAWLARRLRQPLILLCVLTIVAFFLLGGVMTAPRTLSGALPLPSTLNQLANACIHGWRELVTTLPPIDGGVLLALPYLLGLVFGSVGMTLALRLRSAMLPTLPPVALLGTVIMLGAKVADHVALVGSAFGLVLIAWVVLRGRRLVRKTRLSGSAWRTRGLAALMCLGALAGAALLGPSLPGVDGNRYVLRSQLTPPFDIGKYPSPLAGFRQYTPGYAATRDASRPLANTKLFTVTGLPAGARIQIATLDCYDGLVWTASYQPTCEGDANDAFQKVGHTLDNPAPGRLATVSVSIAPGFAGGVWLPTAGNLTNIDFTSGPFKGDFDNLRYNLETGTAAIPVAGGLQANDGYRFTTRIRDLVLPQSSALPIWQKAVTTAGGGEFQTTAAQWSGGAKKPLEGVVELTRYLSANGKYTDGQDGAGTYLPGHSLRNLLLMTAKDNLGLAGDDEQYAALLAVMANQLGVPARVVMGVQAPSTPGPYAFYGKDVHAWVQVLLNDGTAGGTWYTIPTDQFVPDTTHKPQIKLPQTLPPRSAKAIPPPAPVRPPSTLGDPLSDAANPRHRSHSGWNLAIPGFVVVVFKYVGFPAALVATLIGVMTLAKSRRRRRRRTRGPAAVRISAAWRELLDQARDQGRRVTSGLTRREQAVVVGVDGFPAMARAADAHVFRAAEPTEEDAAAYWSQVDDLRAAMAGSLSRVARWRSLVSPVSFLPLPSSGAGRED